jgi:integrase
LLPYKGRETDGVYFLPFLRELFFDTLEAYVESEYIATSKHDFVFQDIRSKSGLGRPFYEISDTGRIKNFKEAASRSEIFDDRGAIYTPHSLRHLYGVYLLNYLPVPGGYGLSIKEVQYLMGHKTDAATRLYARSDKAVLIWKLDAADASFQSDEDTFSVLKRHLVKRLRQEADRIELNSDD